MEASGGLRLKPPSPLQHAGMAFLSHDARKDLNATVDFNRRQVESGRYLN
jgi:hypothetical protein